MPIPPNDEISPEMLAQISARLRPVCPDIPEEEFQRLVRDIAMVKVKYDHDRFAIFTSLTELPNKSATGTK